MEFKRDNKNRPREMSSKKTVGWMVPQKQMSTNADYNIEGGQIQRGGSSGKEGEKGPKVVSLSLMFLHPTPQSSLAALKISCRNNNCISSQIWPALWRIQRQAVQGELPVRQRGQVEGVGRAEEAAEDGGGQGEERGGGWKRKSKDCTYL